MLSNKNISIIAMLYFDVIVRQVIALSLERTIWYNFNSFLQVEIFVEEPFISAKKLLDEHWEEVQRQLQASKHRSAKEVTAATHKI